jgi:mycothiol synthase
MDSSAPFSLRMPEAADLEAVAAVLAADDLDDAGRVVLDTGFVRSQWQRPGFDLHADAVVAVDRTGEVLGYGQVIRVEPDEAASWAVVDPERRGLGIGGALLDRLIARAAELLPEATVVRFQNAINAGDRAAAALLESRGLHLVRHFWHMGIDPSQAGSEGAPAGDDPAKTAGSDAAAAGGAPPPPGIEIEALRAPAELPAVHAVLEEAFADHWDHQALSFAEWSAQHTERPDHDPSLWLVAHAGATVVGALAATLRDERGWVDLLAVEPAHRGRGIGAALLWRSFAAFAARGAEEILLAVDAENATGATALYQSVGMRVVKRWDAWERILERA